MNRQPKIMKSTKNKMIAGWWFNECTWCTSVASIDNHITLIQPSVVIIVNRVIIARPKLLKSA